MRASLAVCILAALLALGSCLQCEVCSAQGNTCTGSMQTCSLVQDSCGIIFSEIILEDLETQNIAKDCVTSSQCKVSPFSLNFGKGLGMRTSLSCCMGDSCSTNTATVPPANTKPNGRSCHGCYGVFTDTCQEETVDCTGAETQCIDIAGAATMGGIPVQIIMKGCASMLICAEVNVGMVTFAGFTANLTRTKCTAASSVTSVTPGVTASSVTSVTSGLTTSTVAGVTSQAARLLLPALTFLLLNLLS